MPPSTSLLFLVVAVKGIKGPHDAVQLMLDSVSSLHTHTDRFIFTLEPFNSLPLNRSGLHFTYTLYRHRCSILLPYHLIDFNLKRQHLTHVYSSCLPLNPTTRPILRHPTLFRCHRSPVTTIHPSIPTDVSQHRPPKLQIASQLLVLHHTSRPLHRATMLAARVSMNRPAGRQV